MTARKAARKPTPRKLAAQLRALLDVVRYNDQGLVPAVIQDAASRRVMTLCYLNREALEKSLTEGMVYVFRRSQNRLMLKGETSGHTQRIVRVEVDCEGRSLLFQIRQKVAGCHSGYFSCYHRRLGPTGALRVIERRVFDPSAVYRTPG